MKSIEITFPKLNHFWLDSGLLGLAVMLKDIDNSGVEKTISDNGLTLAGTESDIQDLLQRAYDLLIGRYYNTSTKKQKEEMFGFFYNSTEKSIKRFPKKKLAGIPALLYGENQIFQYREGIKWENKTQHKLPEMYSDVQSILDTFLQSTGIKSSTSVLLMDSPYEFRPKLEGITLSGKQGKGKCFLCGCEVYGKKREITKGTYPFITSSSGFKTFNSMGATAENICWRCDYISKFIPVNSFYLTVKQKQNEDFFAFFPYSVSFEKMMDVYSPLQDAKYDDPNLFKNFQHPLGFENYADGYFQKPFEVTFAFLHTLYKKVLLHQKADEETGGLNWEEMCDLTFAKAPLEFVVVHAESKGQTSMGKMVWPFRDSTYFFRLIESIEKSGINIKEVMRLLIDFSQKNQENKTILRNIFCERILKKRTILDIVEDRAWDLAFPKDEKKIKPSNPSPLADCLFKYETIIQEGKMTDEERNVAVSLGKTIGLCVSKKDNDSRSRNEIERDIKRLKGDLIKLRKVRKITDFLSELERLQVKYDFSLRIPDGLFEGKLREDNFKEFKGFCNVAAMQAYSNSRYYALKEGN